MEAMPVSMVKKEQSNRPMAEARPYSALNPFAKRGEANAPSAQHR